MKAKIEDGNPGPFADREQICFDRPANGRMTALRYALGTSELKYTGTVKRFGNVVVLDVDWTIADDIDWNSFSELNDKGYFHANSGLALWVTGVIEGLLDLAGDVLGQRWYSVTMKDNHYECYIQE